MRTDRRTEMTKLIVAFLLRELSGNSKCYCNVPLVTTIRRVFLLRMEDTFYRLEVIK